MCVQREWIIFSVQTCKQLACSLITTSAAKLIPSLIALIPNPGSEHHKKLSSNLMGSLAKPPERLANKYIVFQDDNH
jgi:hypothetical protein